MPYTIGEVLALPSWGEDVNYAEASEPLEIATILRREHADLQSASMAKVAWLWTSNELRDRGVSCVAKARLCNLATQGLLTELGGVDEDDLPDYVVEVNADEWLECTDAQRLAVVHHELCHVAVTPRGTWTIAPHDLQEFRAVVEAHGLYCSRVRSMAAAMQPHLPGLDEADDTVVTLSAGGRSVTVPESTLAAIAGIGEFPDLPDDGDDADEPWGSVELTEHAAAAQ